MAGKSDYFENWVLYEMRTLIGFQFWIALYIETPTDVNGSGTEVFGGAGYQRMGPFRWDTQMSAPANGEIYNTVDFTSATAGFGGWQGIRGWAIHDAASGGRQYWWGEFPDAPFNIPNGEFLTFAISQFRLMED